MKSTSYDFSPPRIIGALGDENLDPAFATEFERFLTRRGHNAACLPFRVTPRYLKNVVACMRLMDVAGLVVHAAHARRIVTHLAKMEQEAVELGFVDTVVRRGKDFVGMNAWHRALNGLAKKKRGAVIVAGRGREAAAAMRALEAHAPRRIAALTATTARTLPRNAVVFDFTSKPKRASVKKIVTPSAIAQEAQLITANLLFSNA